ncbi:hypothetical protein FRC08_006132, partial [Ceratobasidium sp. 394]
MAQIVPDELRRKHTAEAGLKEHESAIEALRQGVDQLPTLLKQQNAQSPTEVVPDIMEAMTTEIGRQYNVAIYTLAIWKAEDGGLVSMQSYSLPDDVADPNDKKRGALYHFAHYALANSGISLALKLEDAYPMAWPDFQMSMRPALPPVHPNWEQEKQNLIEWFVKIWQWQGGVGEPNWEKIVHDYNGRHFVYIEEKRMPVIQVLVGPASWDRTWTEMWTRHIRATMDEWGRVSRAKLDTAFQFRFIDKIEGQGQVTYDKFADTIHPALRLRWHPPALSFERRVKRVMQAPAPSGPNRASDMYDHAQEIVERVRTLVPGIDELWRKVRAYEGKMPPQGNSVSDDYVKKHWHIAARRVYRTSDDFHYNWQILKIEYPKNFTARTVPGHSKWTAVTLRDWFEKNPFYDSESQVLKGGFSGVAVGFYAIVQYALNVARVMPSETDDIDRWIKNDLHIYGKVELRSLEKCTELLQGQIDACWPLLGTTIRYTSTDLEERHRAWAPTRWVEAMGKGQMLAMDGSMSRRPSYNLFESSPWDWKTVKTGGEGSDSDESDEEDESSDDEESKDGSGDMEV